MNQQEHIASLIKSFRLLEAEEALNALCRQNVNEPWLFYLLGKLHQQKQDYGLALNHYQKALELDPQHPEAQTGINIIQSILQIANSYYYENPYTDDDLYH